MSKEVFEFIVDTRKDGENARKTGIPFFLLDQCISLEVYWGDGSREVLTPACYTADSAEASEHEYAEPGEYRVSISMHSGEWKDVYIATLDCQDAEFETSKGFNAKTECIRLFKKTLVEIPSPLPSLNGTVQFFSTHPNPAVNGICLRNNLSFLFLHCHNLAIIADNLFCNNCGTICFSYLFYGCRSLVSIPQNIFKGCTEASAFTFCFFGCSKLTEIPERLFQNTYKARVFKGCFKDCSRIASIPAGLFHHTVNADLFSECFQNCISLSSIPEDLFLKVPHATTFSRAFENCGSLKQIPEKLFWNCSSASFFKAVFAKTEIESVPENLFIGCPNAYTFAYAFAWCSKLKEIPARLFSKCKWADSFYGCFYGCVALSRVDRAVFENCIYIRTLNNCFFGCSSLREMEIDVPSRCIENIQLMFEPLEDSDRTVCVPKMSATARMFYVKQKEFGIKVKERPFLWSTLQAMVNSFCGLLKR